MALMRRPPVCSGQDAVRAFRRLGRAWLARSFNSSQERLIACSRRLEEADRFSHLAHPPPHVGGYVGYAMFGLGVGLLCLLLATSARSEDWPRFLGPRADNTSAETGLLDQWPANGPPLLWEKAIGTGYSAPSVRGDLLVLHHRVGGEEIVEAFE